MNSFVRASQLYDPGQGPRPHVCDAALLRWQRNAERRRSA